MNYFYVLTSIWCVEVILFYTSFFYRPKWLLALGGTLGLTFTGAIGFLFFAFTEEVTDIIVQIIMVLQRRGGI